MILDSCYSVRWYGPTKDLVDGKYVYPTIKTVPIVLWPLKCLLSTCKCPERKYFYVLFCSLFSNMYFYGLSVCYACVDSCVVVTCKLCNANQPVCRTLESYIQWCHVELPLRYYNRNMGPAFHSSRMNSITQRPKFEPLYCNANDVPLNTLGGDWVPIIRCAVSFPSECVRHLSLPLLL